MVAEVESKADVEDMIVETSVPVVVEGEVDFVIMTFEFESLDLGFLANDPQKCLIVARWSRLI